MSDSFQFRWLGPVFPGDDADKLMIGGLHVGTVYQPVTEDSHYRRWRVWLTENGYPAEGVSTSFEAAKGRVERHAREALALLTAGPK